MLVERYEQSGDFPVRGCGLRAAHHSGRQEGNRLGLAAPTLSKRFSLRTTSRLCLFPEHIAKKETPSNARDACQGFPWKGVFGNKEPSGSLGDRKRVRRSTY